MASRMKEIHREKEVIFSEMKEMVLACPNGFIYGECECIYLTQGEPGIKYLLWEGIRRKGSLLDKPSVPIWMLL